MQELEKILEEINAEFDRRIRTQLKIMAGLSNDVYRYGYGKSLEAYQQGNLFVEDIIHKHMNDGWIPVEERLPEEKVNPISRDYYEYQVTAKFGNTKDVRYYRYGNGHWWNGPGIVDKYVIAWRGNPEPYSQEQPETCKYTDGSCCWPIAQCGECPNHPERSEEE